MAHVYLDMNVLYAFQKVIAQQSPILNAERQSKDTLIEQTLQLIRRAVSEAETHEFQAERALLAAENSLADAERHTAAINRNLAPDQSPAETPDFYYESVEERQLEHSWAEQRLSHARDILQQFEMYVQSYRKAQEEGIDTYRKILGQSDMFVSGYIKLLIEAKKWTDFGDSGESTTQFPSAGNTIENIGFYQKTHFSVTVKGQPVNRIVWIDTRLDPNLIIPAGTKFSNGRTLAADTTNLELMRKGRAPFIMTKSGLVQIELHHLSGRESLKGAEYFNSADNRGGLVELASDFHDQYSAVLHIPKEKGSSYRVDLLTGGHSADAIFFVLFRRAYWKHRASEFC